MSAQVLVIGKTGQVARALARTLPHGLSAEFLGRDEANLSQSETLGALILKRRPKVVINAAAYTAVDLAEKEGEEAARVNGVAPAALARACAEVGAAIVHYSTDYVFDGSGSSARAEDAATGPLSVYGRTKLEGEQAVSQACAHHVILRTSWVYDAEGKNFVRTMLRFGAEREEMKVVGDQVGAPTSALEIALATWAIVERVLAGQGKWGTYHLVAGGETSWHGFAQAIFEEAARLGFALKVRDVQAIPTSEYPTPAQRPLNSRLSTEKIKREYGIVMPEWRTSLRACLREIAAASANEKGNAT